MDLVTHDLITAGIAAISIIVGWFVIGTQRVTEELTADRRKAYLEVLAQADTIASNPAADFGPFIRAVWAADFVASDEMYEARRLPKLLHDIGSKAWKDEVEHFSELARFESLRNSSMRRRLHRRWYADGSTVPAHERSRFATLALLYGDRDEDPRS